MKMIKFLIKKNLEMIKLEIEMIIDNPVELEILLEYLTNVLQSLNDNLSKDRYEQQIFQNEYFAS